MSELTIKKNKATKIDAAVDETTKKKVLFSFMIEEDLKFKIADMAHQAKRTNAKSSSAALINEALHYWFDNKINKK